MLMTAIIYYKFLIKVLETACYNWIEAVLSMIVH